MNNEISFGAIESPADYRRIYISQLGLSEELPNSYFIDISDLGVWNQKKLGACVGHAMAKYKQKLDQNDTGVIQPLSARFLYAMAKTRDNVADEGTYPSLVAKILKDIGCATENTCPNNTDLTHEEYVYGRKESEIPQSAKDEAYKAKISGYAWVANDIESIKKAIAKASGAACLVQLDSQWWTDRNGLYTRDADKLCPIRPPKTVISGHEIWLCGYETLPNNDLKIYFLNSWDKTWCNLGVGYFLYSEYKNYIVEMLTFTDIPNSLLEEAHNKPKKFNHNFKTVMRLGDRNSEVKALQEALAQEGLFKYEITGYYGPITREAVWNFQTLHCNLSWYEEFVLKGSIAGPKTLLELNKRYNK